MSAKFLQPAFVFNWTIFWISMELFSLQASLSTRVHQWWAAVPCITAGVVFLCSAVYVTCLLFGYDYFSQVCLLPEFIVARVQGNSFFLWLSCPAWSYCGIWNLPSVICPSVICPWGLRSLVYYRVMMYCPSVAPTLNTCQLFSVLFIKFVQF